MSPETEIPFTKRFGFHEGGSIDQDFPQESRVALFHVVREFVQDKRCGTWYNVICELERLARVAPFQDREEGESQEDRALRLLLELPWVRVFEFCERVYAKLLQARTYWDGNETVEEASLESVRSEFSAEINRILMEDNFAFLFDHGRFVRPGHHHMQQAAAAANKILARSELHAAKQHFLKAKRFYQAVPTADYPNAVKEAVAALEAAAKALLGDKESDVRKVLKRASGTGELDIPPTLVKAAEQVYNFRGAAEGVAHGGASGGVVTPEVAELVISVVAAYITYLAALSDRRSSDLPF